MLEEIEPLGACKCTAYSQNSRRGRRLFLSLRHSGCNFHYDVVLYFSYILYESCGYTRDEIQRLMEFAS